MAASQSARLRLLHMRDEIESVSNELVGLDFEIYRNSYALRRITDARSRSFPKPRAPCPRTCGRAIPTRRGPTSSPSAIRCRMKYHRIDDKVLRETATVDLPKLKPIIARMIAEVES
jgi:hypothetical protein